MEKPKETLLAEETLALSCPSQNVSDQPEDPDLVIYNGVHDPENPRNWSFAYKWSVMALLCGMSLTNNLTVLICAPAIPQILNEFHSESQLYSTLIVSIWNFGAIIGCLVMGPLSEIYGRQPVYNIANLIFLVLLVAQTQSKNMAMVIVFRCLNGLSIASSSLNPSIVGDLFITEERGRAQSILSLMPLLGPIIGPILGGYIAQSKGWRWTFGLASIVLAAFGLAFFAIYRESYEVIILRRKTQRLRKEMNNPSLHSPYDHSVSPARFLLDAFLRPLKLFLVPIFVLLSVSSCILNGYIFIIATSITEIFQATYNFSEGAAGLSFLGVALGMALGALLCSVALDWYTKRMKALHNGEIKPEWRLPPMALGFVIAPLGLFIYGWAAQAHIQYVVPIIGTALCGFAAYTVTIPVTTYLVDIFGIYRASAMSAMMMSRNTMSTVLPLAGPPLYSALGLGWGNSVLAFIALALAPLPFFLLKYGEWIRKRSKLEEWL
ncbi:hypothetical protein G7Y89_g3760 [Cudoniella acicularis]|uniref:Major facilitator superfamily (MFS) profile domain-containing protein n=1 Tax=Cudoniella acicularis TaxID=354080 RepID=A0A8H4W4W7_9HELO|nr:hypothetical protein G7Y89_g3760 [Cudoniella acicularis]